MPGAARPVAPSGRILPGIGDLLGLIPDILCPVQQLSALVMEMVPFVVGVRAGAEVIASPRLAFGIILNHGQVNKG
jgi:hypothetical protein